MTIHVGLVGYGMSGAVFHAPLIRHVKGLKLAAVVSSNPEKVKRDHPEVEVLSSLEELLARKDISLIVITTPNILHYPFAKAAITAGKHVIVEKPFTVTSEEAGELIDLARKQGVLLSVYHNRRWDNDFLTVRRLVESGCLGELVLYEVHYDRYRPKVRDRWRERDLPGSGTLYDLGSHLIDQALVLFGSPRTVWADLGAQRPGAQTVDYDTGDPVLLDNVLIVEMDHASLNDGSGRIAIDLESGGRGYLLQKGKMRKIRWENVNGRIVPYDGTEQARLVPGKTWINIVPAPMENVLSVPAQ